MIKTFLANTIVKWYKRIGIAGALRWRLLYWAYKLWPGLHIRDAEWDFVLGYLPRLDSWQEVYVLDAGCAKSLFIYELARRGYCVTALDKDLYQEKIRHPKIRFTRRDLRKMQPGLTNYYHFITCISVLEHISPDSQHEALWNMISMLKDSGRLLLTIPTNEYAQGHPWAGFTYKKLKEMLRMTEGWIVEYTEKKGQICAAIEKYGMEPKNIQ